MPHSKGQLAKTFLGNGSVGFICVETGQARMYCDEKSHKKAFKLHCRVCAHCALAGLDESDFCEDKDVIKEMFKTNSYAMRSTSDGIVNYKIN
jgi:hypothetical protein